jgi:hypothetical protein
MPEVRFCLTLVRLLEAEALFSCIAMQSMVTRRKLSGTRFPLKLTPMTAVRPYWLKLNQVQISIGAL